MDYDFSNTIQKVQAALKKGTPDLASKVTVGTEIKQVENIPENFVVMDETFFECYGILGIPFGGLVQWSGKSDTGKTSQALQVIKRAQEQDVIPIYVETEGKTDLGRLQSVGIDLDRLIVISTNITEEVYQSVNQTLDTILAQDPKQKVVLVIDSFGQTISQRDRDLDVVKDKQKPGGHGSVNRTGLSGLMFRQQKQDIAIFLVNYSYANIGSVGETNAGGRALHLFCGLIVNTSRVSFIDGTQNKQKVRKGVKAKWQTTKNHYAFTRKDDAGDDIHLPSEVFMEITGAGIKRYTPKPKS